MKTDDIIAKSKGRVVDVLLRRDSLLPPLRKIIVIELSEMLLLNAEGVDEKPLKVLDK